MSVPCQITAQPLHGWVCAPQPEEKADTLQVQTYLEGGPRFWPAHVFFLFREEAKHNMDIRVGSSTKYKLVKLIGKGSFGAIYLGMNTD